MCSVYYLVHIYKSLTYHITSSKAASGKGWVLVLDASLHFSSDFMRAGVELASRTNSRGPTAVPRVDRGASPRRQLAPSPPPWHPATPSYPALFCTS